MRRYRWESDGEGGANGVRVMARGETETGMAELRISMEGRVVSG